MMSSSKFTCPCCGYLVFDESPGSYDICPICFWEDDITQLKYPAWNTGANQVSLIDGQRNYIRYGASELRFLHNVRPASQSEPIDPEWRMVHKDLDNFPDEGDQDYTYPEDNTKLYYWRDTYWLPSENVEEKI